MPEKHAAAVYALGTELTEGIIQDSHGQFLASLLTSMGVRVEKIAQLRDAPETAQEARLDARKRRLMIFTGGLGPTSDDITRDVVAEITDRKLVFDKKVWQAISQRYNLARADANRRQAYIPEGFNVLANDWGTAPGFWGEHEGTLFVALPGPPVEMRHMCSLYLEALVRERLEVEPKQISTATAFLVPESVLEDACQRSRAKGIKWRTRVEPFRIHLYIEGETEGDRRQFIQKLQSQLSADLIRIGEVEPVREVLRRSEAQDAVIAAAESCTGGMLGERITAVPGSSAAFWGSAVVYADTAKEQVLGVSSETLKRYGAVSEETAREMVLGTLRLSGADLAVAITGVAGPGGGSEEKPVGTVWIAVGSREQSITAYRFQLGDRRDLVRRRAVTAALLMMEMEIKGEMSVDRLAAWHYS